jgi:hypothetical protein
MAITRMWPALVINAFVVRLLSVQSVCVLVLALHGLSACNITKALFADKGGVCNRAEALKTAALLFS